MDIKSYTSTGAFSRDEFEDFCARKQPVLEQIDRGEFESDMLGWQDLEGNASGEILGRVRAFADEVRKNADYFVVVGLGGSNQGARAVIEALDLEAESVHDKKAAPKILYAALNFSSDSIKKILRQIDHGSVYINVIIKNFKTLEPGVAFRILRSYMESRYSAEDAARRIIVTLTPNDGELEPLANSKGYRYLEFPADVGGRYSVFTAVGLLPIAVAGISIDELLNGAKSAKYELENGSTLKSCAIEYALYRNYFLHKGLDVEVFAFFEPKLEALGKWWRQLFGESEGKGFTGVFPAICSYTEDLHSVGQYMQQGKRHLIETFIHIKPAEDSLAIERDTQIDDGFRFLDGKTFDELNESAFCATLKAHFEGGVPCFVVDIPKVDAFSIGRLLYFFMQACFYSAAVLGVDPFDQPGVENYKNKMLTILNQ